MGGSEALASFVESAPPGELSNVTTAIKTIAGNGAIDGLQPAFTNYNETQFTTVKLPGASEAVVISPYNRLEDGRYFDTGSSTSFAFDHITQKASATQTHQLESANSSLITSALKAFTTYASEHYPSSTVGVFPAASDAQIAFVLVANKYSPNNFWNGRYRSSFLFDPSNGSLAGSIKVDVHYYEDGNVRLLTYKPVSSTVAGSGAAADIVKAISQIERKYQEDLNRAFITMSEGAFKSLRRQLPVTRQKIEWDRVGGYRIGQDISGARR